MQGKNQGTHESFGMISDMERLANRRYFFKKAMNPLIIFYIVPEFHMVLLLNRLSIKVKSVFMAFKTTENSCVGLAALNFKHH